MRTVLAQLLQRPLSCLARAHPLLWRARPQWLPVLWALGSLAVPVALLEPLNLKDLPAAGVMTPIGVLVVFFTAPLYIAFVIRPRRRQPLGHVSGRELLVSFGWTYLGMGLVIVPLCLYDGIVWHRMATLLTPDQLQLKLAEVDAKDVPTALVRVQHEQARSTGPSHPVLNLAAHSWLWRQQGCLAFALLGLLLDWLSSPRRSAWLTALRDWFRRQMQETLGPGGAPGSTEWARLKLNAPGVWAAQLPVYLFPALALFVPAQQAMERYEAGWNNWLLLLSILVAWSLLHFGAAARRHSLQLGTAREWLRFVLAATLGWVAAVMLVLVLPPLLFAWFGEPQQQHRDMLAAAARAPWMKAALGLLLGTQVVTAAVLAHCRVGRRLYGATVLLVGVSAVAVSMTLSFGDMFRDATQQLIFWFTLAAAPSAALGWMLLWLRGRRDQHVAPGLSRTLLAWGCVVAMPFAVVGALAWLDWTGLSIRKLPNAALLALLGALWIVALLVIARSAWRVLRQRGAMPFVR